MGGPVAGLQDAVFAAASWRALVTLLADIKKARVSPDGGLMFPDSKRHERVLRGPGLELPVEPATITTGNILGEGRLLVGDFDVERAAGKGALDPVATVAAEAAAMVALVERCGGRAVHDISPSGGRHVYVKFVRSRPGTVMNQLARALAQRFDSYDPGPMNSPAGQIRPPGTPHKRTIRVPKPASKTRKSKNADRLTGPLSGYVTLTMPLDEAVAVLQRPCGMSVLERLESALAAELAATVPAARFDAPTGSFQTDLSNDRWIPRKGGRRALTPELARIAATGDWSTYVSSIPKSKNGRSEARQAVLNSAAAAGWRLGEVLAEARPDGAFAGLAELLGDRTPAQEKAVMARDWNRAVDGVAAWRATIPTAAEVAAQPFPPQPSNLIERSVSNSDTSPTVPHAPPPSPDLAETQRPQPHDRSPGKWPVPDVLAQAPEPPTSVWHHLYAWATAIDTAERDPVRSKAWEGAALSVRRVLRAILVAARITGRIEVEFGVRSLSLASGVSQETVAMVLRLLRDETDPLVDLISYGVEREADRYQLRIPDAYRADALRRRWRAGRIESGHPAFLRLGSPAALLYEVLGAQPVQAGPLAADALLSNAAVHKALNRLAEHGLAIKVLDEDGRTLGWRRGTVTLDQVAAATGAFDDWQERLICYREDRRQWDEFLRAMGDPEGWRVTEAQVIDGTQGGVGEIHSRDQIALADTFAQVIDTHGAHETWTLPDDVAAAVHADHQAMPDDEPAPHEWAELEQVLREFDDARHQPRGPDHPD